MFNIINENTSKIIDCSDIELYQHRIFIGKQSILTDPRSSYWYITENSVECKTGNNEYIESTKMCVEIFGYTPENRSSTFSRLTDLPYINGCSAKQLIPATRLGDPTFQLLYIPRHTSEQQHHIHATSRIVYVLKGKGISVVGSSGSKEIYNLNKGDIIILGKMIPHHFETQDEELIVIPLHVFSSIASLEFDHPMYNGTHKV